ncbi:hypothetical protein OQJ18_05620 [Fluoribacter dumoffii]|uniref:Substrate of the Dot/Icm secretion system n=1 Tax=Fluoribacter dumoffii TaxID=463 RepID=A0A377G9M9_9GAMM|nr:hypothetical protein [Fluoribacter dumoffii]KTC90082.1 substrate of the Dot/Icm secretion system [Fluoribacter dumoffii NY 23]MCW8385381.1 hypothetical protein [Fluoribacter dumoffii]MCW8418434.1 hypothetical protein [Fluoribacter dumoffii]MCW8453724.1 hypothetical protein [Fluoribacter dumoffii]MCW8462205.1 hypothetical protein [Fluoribacter dumoffii]
MTFTPPAFATFRVNTLNLETNYSILLGRYTIIDSALSDGSSAIQPSSLEVLIARTNEVLKCKSGRDSQIEVFNLLVNELRQIPKENKELAKQGALFLLGALIHRYFRLIKEYDDYNAYASWTYWAKCQVTDCKLFLAIRRALKFKELDVLKKICIEESTSKKFNPADLDKKFRKDDLQILDVVTIVKALEVFRDNMFMEDKDKVQRYMNYPHFAKDENFKSYLEDIIITQSQRGAQLLHRFKAINFIRSLAEGIEKEHQQIEMELEKWCKAVAKEHKNFSTFRNLNDVAINESIMKHVESEKARNRIFDLFYTPLVQENLETLDHPTFLAKMKECYDSKCSYILFGGYALLLQQSEALGYDLMFTIQQVLGETSKELTKEDRLNGLKFLKQFLEIESNVALDYEFFDGKSCMNTLIARAEVALSKEEVKEETTVLTL